MDAQRPQQHDELDVEELEEVAGGNDFEVIDGGVTNNCPNTNCPCRPQ